MAKYVCVAGVLTGLLIIGVETTAAQGKNREPAAASPSSPMVTRTTDPKTGLQITQTVEATGGVRIDVHDDKVSVRKEVRSNGSLITLSAGRDTVSVAIDAQGLTVHGPHGDLRMNQLSPDALAREQVLMAGLPVVHDAGALLARLDLQPSSISGQALWTTRLVLGMLTGDDAAFRAMGRMMAQGNSPQTPRAVKVTLQNPEGPGKCWNLYEQFLMKNWNEFWQCIADHMDSAFMRGLCEIDFVLQAELAMMWVISCMGGLPVR